MPRLNVNPTRIELKKCKERLKATTSGHKLLKNKADEMVRQFLLVTEEAKVLRTETEQKLADALNKFALARASSGGKAVESALYSGNFEPLSVDIGSINIVGTEVPTLNLKSNVATITSIPYLLASAPAELDDAIFNFYDVLVPLLRLAEIEKTCALLAIEIQKIRRRVNALEHIMIPNLQDTVQYIQMRLDENERGALVRLMKVKDNIEKSQK